MSFNSLDEVLSSILKWEQDFDVFYDMMADYLYDEETRKAAKVLQKRHENILEILKKINVDDYKNTEFLKFVPKYHGEDRFELDASASIDNMFFEILEHEVERLNYFNHLKSIVVYEKSKDLFDMLIQLKTQQIKEIRGMMESYKLAI